MSARFKKRVATLAFLILASTLLVGIATPVYAKSIFSDAVCDGFTDCSAKGMGSSGYSNVYNNFQSGGDGFWGMARGHNCTNYVAYRLINNGYTKGTFLLPKQGDASQWGPRYAEVFKVQPDKIPAVGAIAWWDKRTPRTSVGHVAYVEHVFPDKSILVSEDSFWEPRSRDTFDWALIKPGPRYPSGFLHIKDVDPAKAAADKAAADKAAAAQALIVLRSQAMGKIITVTPSKTSYFYDGTLHWIKDTAIYWCFRNKGVQVLNVDTQVQADSLGNGQPWATCVDQAAVDQAAAAAAKAAADQAAAAAAAKAAADQATAAAAAKAAPITPATPAINSIIIDPCLNLRASADGTSALLGCIPKGTIISISCTSTGNAVTGPYGTTFIWDKTTWNGLTGFVSDAYVYTGKSGAAAAACAPAVVAPPIQIPVAPVAVKTGSGKIQINPCLNFRSGPNGATSLIGCIPNGTVITIACTVTGSSVSGPYGATTIWDRTTWNGITGYVSDAYVYTGSASAVAGTCTS